MIRGGRMYAMVLMWIVAASISTIMGCERSVDREARHALECADAYITLMDIEHCYKSDDCMSSYKIMDRLARDDIAAHATIEALKCPKAQTIEPIEWDAPPPPR